MDTYPKPKVSLLITDLDNTLYDWVTYFSEAFTALIEEAEKLLSVPRARLLDDFKVVHQQHHNTEHPFALLEIQSVAEKFAHLSRKEKKEALDPAFYAFNKKRKEKLCLYQGVSETLRSIKATGCIIVGHTEATVPNALFRLSSLELLGFFSRLYAIEPPHFDHPAPQWSQPQYLPNDFVHMVTSEKRKPNPFLLLDICSDLLVKPSDAVYVGDSLTRDMSMAIQAGVRSAWAQYGSDFSADNWDTLVRVSHWTDEDVKRERDLRTKFGSAQPEVVLHAYSDLLREFDFGAPSHHMGTNSGGR